MSRRYRVTASLEVVFYVNESELEDGEAGPDGDLTDNELEEQIGDIAQSRLECDGEMDLDWCEVKA